ncbi:MAG: response regulator [Phycisphaerales bacterium]|nr:response regulator [Phycisphaerales bacterium]
MTIKQRLILLLSIPLITLCTLGAYVYISAAQLEREVRMVADTQIESLATIGRISRSLNARRINLRNCLISQDSDECAKAREAFEADRGNVVELFRVYADRLVTNDEDARLFSQMQEATRAWNTMAANVLADLDLGKREQAVERLGREGDDLGVQLDRVAGAWLELNEDAGREMGATALGSLESRRRLLVAVCMAALGITALLGVIVLRSISRPLDRLRRSVETIAKGDYQAPVPFTAASDEIGTLARSVDVLKSGAAETERQRWTKLNAARIASALQAAATVEEFGRRLVSELTPLLGGGVSAVYEAAPESESIRRVAGFGLADAGSGAAPRRGEGLVGECIASVAAANLTGLPPAYLTVSSGIGSAPPTFVGAWPLVVENSAIAAFEFASFREPGPREQGLIEELFPIAAISLDRLRRNLRTQELLAEMQRQSEALRASEEEFRTLLEAAPDALIISDEQGRIVLVNAQTERLLGYRRDELIGQPIEILVPERTRAAHPGLRRRYHENPEVRAMGSGMELAAVRKDGTEFSVEISLSPLHKRDGRGMLVCSSLRDTTERMRVQDELRRAKQKAEEATVAKSAFLANMSHEIRTPMNGIMGMTELALDTDLSTEQRDYLNTVKSSADALLSLINDILDFSKIEAGRIELDPVEFLLRDSMADTLSPLSLRAATKGVELAYDVAPDVPDALVGDVYRLRQVIVNLIGNAIKFTEHGEVVMSLRLVERSGDEVMLEVAVRDTGIGIDPAAAARLFKAFEQAESSTTRKYGGTGLGLAISKQLVELMGGQIRLESTPGSGSTFTFSVRFKVGTARPSASHDDAAKLFEGKSALVVDDNRTNRRILETMLNHWGLKTIQADSAKSGLTMLDRASNAGQSVSLVVTDLHMPDTDGFEFAQAIRSHPIHRSVPVMLLSSSGTAGDQARIVELGIAARLLKPVKQSLLLDNVMRVLAGPARSAHVPVPVSDNVHPSAVAPKTLRILLAEDNPVNQKFALRVLEGAGHGVTVANNGREAVERSASESFDLVLMDVQMPEMDGLEASRTIRARESNGTGRVPIIAMTANAMKGDREMCIDSGMDGYVPKPVKRDVLFAEIERVLKEVGRGAGVQ